MPCNTPQPAAHWLRPCVQAPELFLNPQALTPACDAWSFGIVLYELLTWQAPYSTLSNFAVYDYVQGGGRPEVPRTEDLPGLNTEQVGGEGFTPIAGLSNAGARPLQAKFVVPW